MSWIALPLGAILLFVVVRFLTDFPQRVASDSAVWIWVPTFLVASAILITARWTFSAQANIHSLKPTPQSLIAPVLTTALAGALLSPVYHFTAIEFGKSLADTEAEEARTASSREGTESEPDVYSDTAVQSLAMQSVKAKLRDPGSAKFRNVKVYRNAAGAKIICGEVNSANGLGGMSGYQPFMSGGTEKYTWLAEEVTDFQTAWNMGCKDALD